jgi:hypothetical protein
MRGGLQVALCSIVGTAHLLSSWGHSTGDALSYVWIGPDSASVAAAGASTTPAGGKLIIGNIATSNAIYNNDVDGDGLTYSSPVIHTVRSCRSFLTLVASGDCGLLLCRVRIQVCRMP